MHQTLRQDTSKFIDIRFCGAKRTRLPACGFLQQPRPYTARTRVETRRSLVREVERNEIYITSLKGSGPSVSYVANMLPTEVPPRVPMDASLVSFIRPTGETTTIALRQFTNLGRQSRARGAAKAGAKNLCVLASRVDVHRRADTCRSGHPAKKQEYKK
jgi:hypothetical protein